MEYDKRAKAFVTYVKELHGMSTFGKTEFAALDNTAEMIRGYIKSMGGKSQENPSRCLEAHGTQAHRGPRLMASDPAVSGKRLSALWRDLGFD